MHLDEGRIQRLLDAELDPATARAAREHLAGCADCRARVAEARRTADTVTAALGTLDAPAPRIDSLAVAARARIEEEPAGLRHAAGFVLALVLVGAAYA